MWYRSLLVALLLGLIVAAPQAQSPVTVIGPVTPGNCTAFNSNTVIKDAGSPCAGVGNVSSVTNSDGTLTVSPTTGPVVASVNLNHANVWTAAQTYQSAANNQAFWQAITTSAGNAAEAGYAANAGSSFVVYGLAGPGDTVDGAIFPLAAFIRAQAAALVLQTQSTNPMLFAINRSEVGRWDHLTPGLFTVGLAGVTQGRIQFVNTSSGGIAVTPPGGALGSQTNTLQAVTDTFVYRNTTDTLTNKTLTSPTFTGTLNFPDSSTWSSAGISNLQALGVGATVPATGVRFAGAFVAPTANGQGSLSTDSVNGAKYGGQGSTNDVSLVNKSGTVICNIATGSSTLTCLNVTAPNVTVSNSLASPDGGSWTSGGVFAGGVGVGVTSPGNGRISQSLLANNVTGHLIKRFTDTSPTGNYLDFQNAAAASLYTVDITGKWSAGQLGGVTVSLGSDATGDIYYRNSGGVLTRLPIGTNGFTLQVSGGLPSWQTSGVASSISVGTTTVGSGCTPGGLLNNNAGTLGCINTYPTTQSLLTGSGTYTTPANVRWIEVTMRGGGGGGRESGSQTSAPAAGGNTCWNTSGAACTSPVYQAGGGGVGTQSGIQGAGGTVSGSGTCLEARAGGSGGGVPPVNVLWTGGSGGGDGGGAGGGSQNGDNGKTNSGGGGGGGASGSGSFTPGGGGGAGAYCRFIITNPAGTYTYAVGAGGGNGVSSNQFNGGSGGSGGIWVVEHYTY